MKYALTVLSLVLMGQVTAARSLTAPYQAAQGLDVEIQIFVNSRPDPENPARRIYDHKYVSSPANIVPANMLYPSPNASNAMCFYGNPDHAIKLFKIMADQMNVVPATTALGQVFLDPARNFKPWLQIDGVNADGVRFRWFDRVRMCDAPADDFDRRTTPLFIAPFED